MRYITVIIDQERLSADQMSKLFTQDFVRAVAFRNLLDSEDALEQELLEMKDFINSFQAAFSKAQRKEENDASNS